MGNLPVYSTSKATGKCCGDALRHGPVFSRRCTLKHGLLLRQARARVSQRLNGGIAVGALGLVGHLSDQRMQSEARQLKGVIDRATDGRRVSKMGGPLDGPGSLAHQVYTFAIWV